MLSRAKALRKARQIRNKFKFEQQNQNNEDNKKTPTVLPFVEYKSGNYDLYNSKNVSDIRIQNFISLFRLELSNNFPVSKHMKGKPIYLGLATDENKIFKLKPQNLIFNLPLTKKYKESLIDK